MCHLKDYEILETQRYRPMTQSKPINFFVNVSCPKGYSFGHFAVQPVLRQASSTRPGSSLDHRGGSTKPAATSPDLGQQEQKDCEAAAWPVHSAVMRQYAVKLPAAGCGTTEER